MIIKFGRTPPDTHVFQELLPSRCYDDIGSQFTEMQRRLTADTGTSSCHQYVLTHDVIYDGE